MPDPIATPQPIRIPSWLYTIVVVLAIPLAVAVLSDVDWKPVLATSIVNAAGYLAIGERAARQVTPNVKVVEAVDQSLAIGYAQGLFDGVPAPVPAKKAPAKKKAPPT